MSSTWLASITGRLPPDDQAALSRRDLQHILSGSGQTVAISDIRSIGESSIEFRYRRATDSIAALDV